jgi:hypothetical protein
MKTLYQALALTLMGSVSYAQEIEPLGSYSTVTLCYDPGEIAALSAVQFRESPLFTGVARIDSYDADGDPAVLEGNMVFAVNQDTGTWAMLIRLPQNVLCTVAAGNSFEPWTDPRNDKESTRPPN